MRAAHTLIDGKHNFIKHNFNHKVMCMQIINLIKFYLNSNLSLTLRLKSGINCCFYSDNVRCTIISILSPAAAISGTVRQQSKSCVLVPLTWGGGSKERVYEMSFRGIN